MNEDSKTQRKRRTCVDRVRRNIGVRRRSNPASKTILQLLGLFSAILAIARTMPDIVSTSGRDRRRRPSWYPNGPAAWARERGLEPDDGLETGPEQPSTTLRPKRDASWSRLVKDLNRRSTRERARELIETRVPPEALEWLREIIKLEDWMALRLVGHDRTKDEIRDFTLLEAIKWQAARMPSVPPASPAATAESNGTAPPVRPGPK